MTSTWSGLPFRFLTFPLGSVCPSPSVFLARRPGVDMRRPPWKSATQFIQSSRAIHINQTGKCPTKGTTSFTINVGKHRSEKLKSHHITFEFVRELFFLTQRVSLHAAMTLVILVSLKTMQSLKNGLQSHSKVTPLFSMRAVALASSQSCRSVDTDARFKRVVTCFLSRFSTSSLLATLPRLPVLSRRCREPWRELDVDFNVSSLLLLAFNLEKSYKDNY